MHAVTVWILAYVCAVLRNRTAKWRTQERVLSHLANTCSKSMHALTQMIWGEIEYISGSTELARLEIPTHKNPRLAANRTEQHVYILIASLIRS